MPGLLEYRLEYFQGYGEKATDDGVFIHLRTDVPAYIDYTNKEAFTAEDEAENNDDEDPTPMNAEGDDTSSFIEAIFNTPGVVAAACHSHRIYIEKSPAFQWAEVINPVVDIIRGATDTEEVREFAPPIQLTNNDKKVRRMPKLD